MKLKEILNELNEGKHDQNIYKAVFLSGLPASGKTEFYNYALKHKDFKHLDSDKILSFLVRKHKDDLKDTRVYQKYSEQIDKKIRTQSEIWTDRGLGLVIDTTGQDLNKILEIKNVLENKGYDTAMVFIEKKFQDAVDYSKTRDRAVDKSYIINVKEKLSKNEEIYQKSFSPFIKIEGRNPNEYSKAEKKLNNWLRK